MAPKIAVLFLNFTIFFIILNFVFVASRIDFYKGESRSSYSCDVDITEPFSCICLFRGFWKIYSSCLEFNYIGVRNQYCFSPLEKIRRIEKISSNNSKLVVIRTTDRLEFDDKNPLILPKGDLLAAHSAVTISDGLTSVCLGSDWSKFIDQYCLFEVNDLSSIQFVVFGCTENDPRISPIECHELVDDQNVCPASFQSRNLISGDLARRKRMLLPHPVEKNPIANNADPDDEDFWDPTGAAPYGPDVPAEGDEGKDTESPIIVSEIWNYLDQQLDEVLGLGNPGAPPASMQEIPVFQILDASKQLMLKTCPPFYVQPDFLDLAVDTFAAVLMKRNYLKEFNHQFEGMNRIITALNKCKQNATMFPFIDESSHDECDKGHVKTNPGVYSIFDNQTELVVPESMESYENDPIIDVIWKIFVNTYQTCFHWFDPTHNDVFRYATIMESLFQGEIHDLWTAGKTQGKMLGGFLGNMKEITEYATLCVGSSALETKFPWSLNRPEKMTDAETRRIKRHVQHLTLNEDEIKAVTCSANAQCLDLFKK